MDVLIKSLLKKEQKEQKHKDKKSTKRKLSLKYKLIFSTLIALILPMSVATYYSISKFSKQSEEELQVSLQSQGIAAGIMLDNEVNKIREACSNIAKDNTVVVSLQLDMTNQLSEYAKTLTVNYPVIDELVIASSQEIIYQSTDQYSDILENVRSNSSPVNGLISKESLNVISAQPVIASDGTLLGVVLITHNMTEDLNMLSSISEAVNCNLLLYHGDNLIAMGDKSGNILPAEDSNAELVTKAVYETGSDFTYEPVKLYENNYFVYSQAIYDINNQPIGILSVAETDENLKHARSQILTSMLVIAFLGILVASVAVFLISYFITKPIMTLLRNMKKVQEGDLTISVKKTTNDEIGDLTEGFNLMVRDLRLMTQTIIEKSAYVAKISGELSEAYHEITRDISRINTSIMEVSSGLTDNSATMEEVTASIEEIAGGAVSVFAETQDAMKISNGTVEKAKVSKEVINQAKESVSRAVEETNGLADLIAELGKSSQKITDVVNAITDIANNTNLLGLNASIEAARAGEAGKGFAVVASEINKLANTTKANAEMVVKLNNDIMQKISLVTNEMHGNSDLVKNSFQVVNDLEITLEDFIQGMHRLDASVQKINDATSAQADSTQQISSAMDSMSSTSVQTAASVSEIAVTVEREKNSIGDTLDKIQSLDTVASELLILAKKFVI